MGNPVKYLVRYVFRLRFVARWIFGIKFNQIGPDDYYFDLVSWFLVKVAASSLSYNTKLLDMGTGPHAIVGLSLWKKLDADVTAADISGELVALAKNAVRLNEAPIRIVKSNFFDEINEVDFEAVVFNAPYVPFTTGASLGLPAERMSQWNGGLDGTAVISEFLLKFSEDKIAKKAFIGVNRWFVGRDKIVKLVELHENLRLLGTEGKRILPADIHIIEHLSAFDGPLNS